jgi:hypothetical protein
MSEQFREQGGAATMDPSRLKRWLTSRVITRLNRPGRVEKAQQRAERERQQAGRPHVLEYFHQVDDAWSHLGAQALAPLLQRYGVVLVPHLVSGPKGAITAWIIRRMHRPRPRSAVAAASRFSRQCQLTSFPKPRSQWGRR